MATARGYFRALTGAASLKHLQRDDCPLRIVHFRALTGAASLKQRVMRKDSRFEPKFPRLNRRGLIEARSGRTRFGAYRTISAP